MTEQAKTSMFSAKRQRQYVGSIAIRVQRFSIERSAEVITHDREFCKSANWDPTAA